jgi:thioredoxin 2
MTAVTGGTIIVCPNCGAKNRVPATAKGHPRCGKCHRDLPWMADADDRTFAEVVEQATVPVLVDVWAPWCGPCRMVSPALEQLAHERAGQLKLVKVNADDSPELSRRFEIQSIPTLMVVRDGQVLARQIGAAPVDTLRNWLNQVLPSGTDRA